MRLDGTVDLIGSDASGTNISSSYCSVVIDSDSLDVRIPFSSGMSIGMGYVVSGNLSLSANFTLP